MKRVNSLCRFLTVAAIWTVDVKCENVYSASLRVLYQEKSRLVFYFH